MKGVCLLLLALVIGLEAQRLGFSRFGRADARFARVARGTPVYRILMGGMTPQFEKRMDIPDHLLHVVGRMSPRIQKREDPEIVVLDEDQIGDDGYFFTNARMMG